MAVAFGFASMACSTTKRKDQVEGSPKTRAAAIDIVRLSPGARQALSAYDPGFFVTGCRDAAYFEGDSETRPDSAADTGAPADAAFTVEGDFNGDGDTDLAVLGMTESHRALLALFCAGDNCSVIEVERWPRTRRGECEGRLFLRPETPGLKRSPREARPLRLKHDAVRIYYDRAAQAIMYYQKDGFNSFIMHD
ncbi:MAG: hypothetical protein NXI24_17985 [bacterium]|nr:hypothetical protein [bacterium]